MPCVAVSAVILGYFHGSIHLFVVAGLTIATKVFFIPWILRQAVGYESYAKREISQVINIPVSLLLAVVIAIFSYYIASPLLTTNGVFEKVNLPIGMASLLIGAYTVTVRGEAVPQLLGILAWKTGPSSQEYPLLPICPLSLSWRPLFMC